jgi:uncharacterized oxidoreductase
MNISNKTALITGGGSGIGFHMARLLGEQGSKVIITGRTEEKLKNAVSQMKNAEYFVCDITQYDEVYTLTERLKARGIQLDLLVNNAGNATVYDLLGDTAVKLATTEINTNYTAVINLTNNLLPLLKKSEEAAIVNVTSIVAFAPGAVLGGYSASKAALHSYTQSLRHHLSGGTNIKVFELMPPLVNTEFSKEIGGEKGMPPEEVAQALVEALQTDTFEIHVGMTADFYKLYLSSPQEAFRALNQA